MRIPGVAALLAFVAGLFRRKSSVMTKRTLQLASPPEKPRNKVARPKRVKYQAKLRKHFARNNLLRHGFEVPTQKPPIRPDAATRQVFANARKRERQAS